ncbi:hypothetical protein ABIB15_001516 [Marisediminicola sp. UYEF4]|uniref:hypothetical protein n=1 Tax=Marisediminicola sp. UYEF4 TaxID=1756384 RepID=UPI0033981754
MRHEHLDPALFIAELRAQLRDRDISYDHGASVLLIGTGLSPENYPLVIYREGAGGPLVGMCIDINGFASLFKPDPNERERARFVWDEMADPSGPGPLRDASLDTVVLGADAGVGWRLLTA